MANARTIWRSDGKNLFGGQEFLERSAFDELKDHRRRWIVEVPLVIWHRHGVC
jgi:hypothetical protein